MQQSLAMEKTPTVTILKNNFMDDSNQLKKHRESLKPCLTVS